MRDHHLIKKAELLAPAGDMDCLRAALNAGADAVYLAGPRFGARAYARNFSEEELPEAIRTAHLFGTAVYITANVLTKDREMPETLSFVKRLRDRGLDGVIVQDTGLLSALHRECPDLPLHASTQMSVSSPEGIRYLKRFGIRRVVPARELSLQEIRVMKKEGVEIEAFIHGAMCYSYSGRCLMSSFLGGRSGNRGRCAGTCRLPFEITGNQETFREAGESYPLSMRDLSVLSILPDLLDAGIDAFKVEGRMKSPEYVAGVISVYRKYIDRYSEWVQNGRKNAWTVEKEDRDLLENLYIRTDLSTGYYMGRDTRKLVTLSKPGYRKTPDAVLDRLKTTLTDSLHQVPAEGLLTLEAGKEASLFVMCGEAENMRCAEVRGSTVQPAKNRPLSETDIRTKMEKTGGTPFYFKTLTIRAEGNIFLPMQALGELRRKGFEKLLDEFSVPLASRRQESFPVQAGPAASVSIFSGETSVNENSSYDSIKDAGHFLRGIFAQVMTREQADAAFESDADGVIFELESKEGKTALSEGGYINLPDRAGKRKKLVLALPQIMRGPENGRIRQAVQSAAANGFDGILVRTADELQLVLEERDSLSDLSSTEGGDAARETAGGFPEILADHSLYTWNDESVRVFSEDCGILSYPFELNAASLKDLSKEAGPERFMMTVYGKVPLMVSAGCVRQTASGCSREEGFLYLKDRKGAAFPVFTACGDGIFCHNVIYNSVPLSLYRFIPEPPVSDAGLKRLMFTDETGEETGRILRTFMEKFQDTKQKAENVPGSAADKGNDIPALSDYTTGHFRKGAL